MPSVNDTISSLDRLKSTIIDYAILVGGIIGLLAWFITVIEKPEFVTYRIIEFVFVSFTFVLYRFRRKIPLKYKINGALTFIYVLVITDVISYGAFGSNTVFLILGGYVALLIYSKKVSLMIYSIGIIIYISAGFIDHYVYPFNPADNTLFDWIIHSLVISIAAIPILFYQARYIDTVKFLFEDLNQKNRSLTQREKELEQINQTLLQHELRLESLVRERTMELEKTNEELRQQKEEVQKSYDELKEAQEQLVQSEKMATLGILTAGVGHEINNPLNYIRGGMHNLTTIIDNESNGIKKSVAPFLSIINEGIERASSIVKSLTHFSRQNPAMNELCDVHTIIDNCLIMLHNKTKKKAEVIKYYSGERFKVIGNEGKLHQVFLNILSNAVQSISDWGLVTITTVLEKERVNVKIQDTGVGITAEDMRRISDPFFTTKEPGEGTGLGLYITQNILNEHKGTWRVESQPGEGTEFTVILPVTIDDFIESY